VIDGSGSLRPALAQLFRWATALVLSGGVVAGIGLVRLARQFPSAAESPSLLVPFLLPVVALALEAGALVALSAAQRGALAASPAERKLAARAGATLLSLVATVSVLLAAQLVPRGTEHPGRLANELIQSAVGSCGDSGEVVVPLLGLSVRCGEQRRITGPMPGVRSVQVAMSSLEFSDDLRRVEIRELTLDAKRALSVRLRASTARIAGIAPWSRSTRLSTAARLGVLALLATALWATGIALAARGASPRAVGAAATADSAAARWRWLGAILAGLPGVAVATGFVLVDQEQATPWAFVGAASLGIVVTLLLGLLARRRPQMFSSFGGF
jgi:hypothetical protein